MGVIFFENFFFGHLQFRDFLGISRDEGGLLAVIRRFWVFLGTLDYMMIRWLLVQPVAAGGARGCWCIPWLLEEPVAA